MFIFLIIDFCVYICITLARSGPCKRNYLYLYLYQKILVFLLNLSLYLCNLGQVMALWARLGPTDRAAIHRQVSSEQSTPLKVISKIFWTLFFLPCLFECLHNRPVCLRWQNTVIAVHTFQVSRSLTKKIFKILLILDLHATTLETPKHFFYKSEQSTPLKVLSKKNLLTHSFSI